MIKVSVMYPYTEGAAFDHHYYAATHMPLVKELLAEGCTDYAIDKGLSGATPGSAPAYVAMCHIYSETLEAFQAGIAANGAQIFADIPNFTALAPIVQISEVVA